MDTYLQSMELQMVHQIFYQDIGPTGFLWWWCAGRMSYITGAGVFYAGGGGGGLPGIVKDLVVEVLGLPPTSTSPVLWN